MGYERIRRRGERGRKQGVTWRDADRLRRNEKGLRRRMENEKWPMQTTPSRPPAASFMYGGSWDAGCEKGKVDITAVLEKKEQKRGSWAQNEATKKEISRHTQRRQWMVENMGCIINQGQRRRQKENVAEERKKLHILLMKKKQIECSFN